MRGLQSIKSRDFRRFPLITFIIFMFLINNSTANAETIRRLIRTEGDVIVESYQREIGLSNLSVSNIIEDRFGFIWFGTQVGLNRFDGNSTELIMKNPFEDDRLVHNLIQTMYYNGEEHQLIIGTYQGISIYDIHHDSYENFTVEENGLSNPVIIALAYDYEKDYLWAGTMEGLNRIDLKDHSVKTYDIEGDVVRSLLLDSQNRLLIGTYEGLFEYDEESDRIMDLAVDTPTNFVMDIKEFDEGTITLGLWDGGVVELNRDNEITKSHFFEDNRIYTVTKTRDDILWAGSWGGGLFAVVDNDILNFSPENSSYPINNPVVYALLEDKSGSLWIGTNGGGVNKINPRKRDYRLYAYDPDEISGLPQGRINSMLKDQRGNLWVGVYNQGLSKIDENGNITAVELEKDGVLVDQVMAITQCCEDQILFGTNHGMFSYDVEQDGFNLLDIPFREGSTESTSIYAIEDVGNEEIWIGTYSGGAYRYNLTSGEIRNFTKESEENQRISDNLVYDLLYDGENIWIATNNGLNVFNIEEETMQTHVRESGNRDKLPVNSIRTLFQDLQGNVWIGMTGGGISLYQGEGTFKTYTTEEGLSSNVITSILQGEDGRLWLGSHEGLNILDHENEHIFNLKEEDGVGGLEFNPAAFKDEDGSLLFGGAHGIVRIPEDYQLLEEIVPSIYITDVKIYGESQSMDFSVLNGLNSTFPHNDNFLTFDFVALDYDAPSQVVYNYRLLGFDNEWVNARNMNFASFSNLQPGNYEFQVYGETVRGVESEIASFHFEIGTPWYFSNFAYMAYILLLGILTWSIIRVRDSFAYRRKNEQLSLLNRKFEQANKQLEYLSENDTLTTLYNRRYFNQKLQEYIALATRTDSSLALIMIDIDHFKSINDTFGHHQGDEILKTVANIIKSSLRRETDFASRFGGDEYIITLYDTEKEGAKEVADMIVEKVEDLNQQPEMKEKGMKLSLSIGVTEKEKEDNHVEKLLVKVDRALYSAKEEGRDRIVVN